MAEDGTEITFRKIVGNNDVDSLLVFVGCNSKIDARAVKSAISSGMPGYGFVASQQ